MKNLERTLKALANKRRLAILQYLKKERAATVGDIAAHIHLSFRSTSKHLAVLASADIFEKDQKGPMVFYHIAPKQKSVVAAILKLV